MSALTFLSMSIIPTIALTEIGVRGSVAIYFFGFLSENVVGIMTASFTLWIINLGCTCHHWAFSLSINLNFLENDGSAVDCYYSLGLHHVKFIFFTKVGTNLKAYDIDFSS